MAFRFKLSEPFEEGCRRVVREQIERAQTQLRSGADAAVAVHETRKCLKRLRALVRLIRPAVGDQTFRFENAHLREIGAMLSGARDRHVLIETITKLEAFSGHDGLADPVRKLLTEQGDDVDAAAMKQALKELDEAKRRLMQVEISGSGFSVVGGGLEVSYRKACKAFKDAYRTPAPADEVFHEWRKGVQQHWRHMSLLSRAWPNCLDARVAEARELSQILGDDHDLAILAAFVHCERASTIPDSQKTVIEDIARARQHKLRTIAHPIGKRLFAESPKALRRRMALYWKAAVTSKQLTTRDAQDAVPKAIPAAETAPKEQCAQKASMTKKSGSKTSVSKAAAAKTATSKTGKDSKRPGQRRGRSAKTPV